MKLRFQQGDHSSGYRLDVPLNDKQKSLHTCPFPTPVPHKRRQLKGGAIQGSPFHSSLSSRCRCGCSDFFSLRLAVSIAR
ncbi:hypothetical protein LEMLEM_LOCUS8251 [Lemmus lemmus]